MNQHHTTTTRRLFGTLSILALLSVAGHRVEAQTIVLGASESFAVLAATTVTTSGASTLIGDLGVSPSGTIVGFTDGDVDGAIHLNTATSLSAQEDATIAYNQLAGLTPTQDITGSDLGARTLNAGVYSYASSAAFNGLLTLDGQDLAGGLFVFQIGSTLTTANASFNFINGASADNVWFQIGSSSTLGAGTSFAGTIIANVSNTLATGVTIDGRIFALTGAITMDAAQITNTGIIPEPASQALIVALAALLLVGIRRPGHHAAR